MSSSAPSSTTGGQPASLTTVIDGRHHLVGSRCNSCGTHSFPTQAACSRCGAATADVALPATGTAQQLFSACVAHGGEGWDHSGMVRALEKLSNFEIGQQAG